MLQVKVDEIPDKIECSASSYPEPNYYWLHGDETVITGSVLNLDFPIKRSNEGVYTCVAENRHGKQMASAELDVLCKFILGFRVHLALKLYHTHSCYKALQISCGKLIYTFVFMLIRKWLWLERGNVTSLIPITR